RTGTSPMSGEPWLRDLYQVWPTLEKSSHLQSNLPPDFEKVTDLPPTGLTFHIPGSESQYYYTGWIALVPVTVVVDVAALPFELIGGIGIIVILMLSGDQC